jgi:hypothetical protein
MDFLCPNCQKMLTVPDQYAGTLMKCPLCQNPVQAPALPTQQAPLAAAALPVDVAPPGGGADVYGLKDPVMAAPPPASAVPPPTSVAASTGSAPPALNRSTAPPPPLPPSTDYRGGFTVPLSTRVLPWVVVGALGLVFLLQLFPWVGYYLGYGWRNNYGVLTQGAWGAAFGSYGEDLVWEKMSGFEPAKQPPGFNLLMLLYLFLFLFTLALAIAAVVVPRLAVKLPPQVDQVWPYRWAIVGALALLGFLALGLLLLLGFTLEHRTISAAQDHYKDERAAAKTSEDHQIVDLKIAQWVNALGLQRTNYLRLAVLLQLVAAIAAGLTFWVEYRGSREPVPQLALRW